MAGQQLGQGFGQTFGQQQPAFGQPFGQPGASSPAFTFGAVPTPPPPLPSPQQQFSFGQSAAQPSIPFGQQPSAPTDFGFGQPQQQQQQHQPAPAFGSSGGGFGFGAAAPPSAAPAPKSFDFGSALRREAPQSRPAAPSAEDAEQEEAFDYEAAKRAALAAMPSFGGGPGGGGGGARGSSAPKPKKAAAAAAGAAGAAASGARLPPPPGLLRRGGPKAAAAGETPEEQARRLQRASRFAPVPSSQSPAAAPPPAATAAPPPPAAAAAAASFSAAAHAFGGGDDGEEGAWAGRGPIVGTCEEMCPADERVRRQNMSDIQIFERVDPNNNTRTSAELAVKRFARTIDNPQPSDFRTRGALTRTMAYLRALLDKTDVRFGLVHKFLWDRYRSVRQDLYIQGISDGFAISIYEEIVRFHILCQHELAGEDQNVTEMEGFNSHLNVEQMNKAMISLHDMYDKAAEAGRPSPNEAEFRAYHMLSIMATHGKFKGDPQSMLTMLQTLRPEVRSAPLVQWVIKIRQAYFGGDFARFFLLVEEAPYLPACLAHIYFPTVRASALRNMADAMCPLLARPALLEASWLRRTLRMESDDEVVALAASHGFAESTVDAETGEVVVVLRKGKFVETPDPAVPPKPSPWISAKAPGLRSVCVTSTAGRPLSAEEAAALREEERRAAAARQEAVAAAQAEAQQRRQAAQAAAAAQEAARREAEEAAQRQAMERQRAELARAQAQQQAEDEARRRAEQAAAAEARRQAEAAAERERRAAEQRAAAEAARRAAAEAEARRLEAERRRRAAEEAERRRREAEERRKAEELQRAAAALRARAISRRFLERWVVSMRRLVAERRRQERMAASLKACRVGVAPQPASEAEMAVAEVQLGQLALGAGAAQQERRPLDLPALVGPLVARRSAAADALVYKLALLSCAQHVQHVQPPPLARWLSLQLSGGTVRGAAHVDGPVRVENKTLATCMVPGSVGGAAGAVVAVAGGSPDVAALRSAISPAAAIPVLFVAADAADAQAWAEAWGGEAMGVSVGCSSAGLAFSRPRLVQGLRWLAAHAPPQPTLSVVRLEDAARDALTAALPVGHLSAATAVAALHAALDVVEAAVRDAQASAEAAWRWPPTELSEGGVLRAWYEPDTAAALLLALDDVRALSSSPLLGDAQVAVHMRLGASLADRQLLLVLPVEAHARFRAALDALAAHAAQQQRDSAAGLSEAARAAKQGTTSPDRSASPTRLNKRKWRHSPESLDAKGANAKLQQTLSSVQQRLALERSMERSFESEVAAVAGVGGGCEKAAAAAEDIPGAAAAAVSSGSGGVLQELNTALAAERKASASLWSRMRSMATSLF